MVFTACRNVGQHLDLFIDQNFHSGNLCGYALVYEITMDGRVVMSDDSFPIYEDENGSYTIEYEGDDYVLTKLVNPIDVFNDGSTVLMYRIAPGFFIEEIPDTY